MAGKESGAEQIGLGRADRKSEGIENTHEERTEGPRQRAHNKESGQRVRGRGNRDEESGQRGIGKRELG